MQVNTEAIKAIVNSAIARHINRPTNAPPGDWHAM